MHFPVATTTQEHASRKLNLNPFPTRDPTDVEVLFCRVEVMEFKRVKTAIVTADLTHTPKMLACL